MPTRLTLLTMLAAALGVAGPGAARAGYDPRAETCTFHAKRSFYGHDLAGPEGAADLIVEWHPGRGEVTRYEWYLPRGNPAGPYSTLTGPPRHRPPTLNRNIELGPWVLSALVDSHLPGGRLTGHLMTALLFPRHGEAAEWHFAGIFEQTGSGYISATGTVTCR